MNVKITFQLINTKDGSRSHQAIARIPELRQGFLDCPDHSEYDHTYVLVLAHQLTDDDEWILSTAPLITVNTFIKFFEQEATSNG